MTVLEIFIFHGDQLLGSRIFSESAITIGRGGASMLKLDDRQISRHHATIRVDGARLYVRDEASQIGTLVNGEPIKEKTFREQDTIQIGSFRLKVTKRSMGRTLGDFDEEEPTGVGQRKQEERLLSTKASPSHLTPTPVPVPAPSPSTITGEHEVRPAPEAARPAPGSVESQRVVVEPQPPAVEAQPRVVEPPPLRVETVTMPLKQVELTPPPIQHTPPLPSAVGGAPSSTKSPSGIHDFDKDPSTAKRTLPAFLPDPSEIEEVEDYDDDDEEEEEEEFIPSFSLLEMLEQAPQPHISKDLTSLRLEIIHHRRGKVLDVHQLGHRRGFPGTGRRLVRLDGEGRAQLAVTEEVGGVVYINNRTIPLEEIRKGAKDRKGVGLLEMRIGDRADIWLSQAGHGGTELSSQYYIRFVRVPSVSTRDSRSPLSMLGGLLNRYVLGAVIFHLTVLGGISLLPASEMESLKDETRFAEVSLKAIEVEPPPEEPPPEPIKEDPTPVQPEPVAPPPKVRPSRTRAKVQRPVKNSALAALEMLKPAASANPLKDAVSNINAVSVPADARSRFKVGGAIGKLPVGDVRVSTAGVARDATSSGRELLSKENVGSLKAQTGAVRGTVKQAPPAALQAAGSGRLSRAQIQKVINEHVAQVQACYEKHLMRDHSLAGKITFDWVIAPSGSISSVRVRSSTMAGSAVSSCIMQEMRSWAFPQPEGGSVTVTYPFIFSAQGF